jgi:hypothetical protein
MLHLICKNNFKIHGNDFFMTSCKNMNFDWIFGTTVKFTVDLLALLQFEDNEK